MILFFVFNHFFVFMDRITSLRRELSIKGGNEYDEYQGLYFK